MATREIRTFQESLACDVCGRTLLRGERTETWLAGGNRREVCELCTARARHEGWIREGSRLEMTGARTPGEGRRSLLGKLRERGERVVERARPGDPADEDPEGDPAPEDPPPAEAPVFARPVAAEASGSPREPRHVRAVPTDPGHRIASALEIFNASEYPRTVAGVARSLGVPVIAIRPASETSRVAIVVSWELSWYRYEVDLSDPRAGVERTAQGYELSELPEEDRLPSATADEYGRLHLGAA